MKIQGKILAVDDNQDLLKSLQRMLKFDFEEFYSTSDPKKIPSIIKSKNIDVVLLDMNFTEGDQSGNDGLHWLKRIKEIDETIAVIMITAYADIDIAVKAIQAGATNFVTKPWEPQKLIANLSSAIELRQSKKEVDKLTHQRDTIAKSSMQNIDPIVGSSPALNEVLKITDKVAKTDANVLILGENGTGKELLARRIHESSDRKNKIFLSVDLNTLSENLFESELFGYKKGAFTDAKEDKKGRIEAASGGTLFLDEIGNLSISLQAKLLTVLQNREFTPVGSSIPIKFDVRLICASNKNIKDLISKQLFREDLYFRINTIELNNPSLRERKEDILPLAQYFLTKFCGHYNKPNIKFNTKAAESLEANNWPGNIRELKHTIERSVILNESGIISSTDLHLSGESNDKTDLYTLNLDKLEQDAIDKALKDTYGNISKASKLLGISRTSLYSKIAKHGL